ncbi:MAG: ArnT family glycosyltransferase [Candidatus Binataceae bacterium]
MSAGQVAPSTPPRAKDAAIVLIAMVLALLVLSAGITRPFEKDAEPQSAEWIQNIVSDGNWLLPQSYYGRLARKPPLFYWLAAGVTKLTGGRVDEARARVASLAAGAALAVVVLMWTRAAVGAGVGWLAFAFVVGSYGFASRATLALTDMLMTLSVVAAYCLMYALLEDRGSIRRAAAVGAILGLGVLAKGPVAIILAAIGALFYLLLTRRNPIAYLRRGWPWVVLGVALAVALTWYLPAVIKGGGAFASLLFDENLGHFLPERFGGTGEGRGRAIYHVLVSMLRGALPLSLLLPAVIAAAWTGEFAPSARRPLLYQASLVAAVAVLFTFASVRRDDYFLPALPGIAILCACVFSLRAPDGAKSYGRTVRNLTCAALAAVVVAVVLASPVAFRGSHSSLAGMNPSSTDELMLAIWTAGAARLEVWFVILASACLAGATIVFAALRRRGELALGAAVGILALAMSLQLTAAIRPEIARLRTWKPFIAATRSKIGDSPLYVVAGHNHLVSFYYGIAVWPLLRDDRTLARPQRVAFVVAQPKQIERLPADYRNRMHSVMQSDAIGGGGPPVLYELAPTASSELNPRDEAAK